MVTHQQFSLPIVHVELKQEAFTIGPVDLSHWLHLKPAADDRNNRGSYISQRYILSLVF